MNILNEQEVRALKKIAQKALVPNLVSKQITDLAPADSFDAGDLLLVRKSGEGVDKSITQQKFIETLGNPSVIGFIATSTIANEIVLTPTNDVVIDKYYDKMVVTFISPITSTGAVNIKIAGLTNKLMREIQTTNTSTLVTGKYYTAIYNISDSIFYQTNIVTPYIFTNEYIAAGIVQPGNTSTKYALTTAIGTPKTATGYYNGMSVLFTANIASKGAVILNVDGLGEKSLQDPIGDNIPFDLLANEAIMAIYDGTVFRKRMFSNLEPIDPDPIDPPSSITVTVGVGGAYDSIANAILALCQQYGEDGSGRTATIQPLISYVIPSVVINRNTPWITVKAAEAGSNMTGKFNIAGHGNIKLTGRFILNGTQQSFITINNINEVSYGSSKAIVFNATIERTPVFGEAYKQVVDSRATFDNNYDTNIIFENVNILGFHGIYTTFHPSTQSTPQETFAYTTGDITLSNYLPTASGISQQLITSGGRIQLTDVNFNNCSRNDVNALFMIYGSINTNNVTITCSSDKQIMYIASRDNQQSILTNTSLRNTTASTKPAVSSRSALLIDGGDYRHPNSSSSPDIVAEDYVNAVIQLRNFNPASPYPQGSTAAVGQGRIVPNQ